MIGNFGAALSPVLLGKVQEVGGWSASFVTCAVAFLVAAICSLFLNAARPLEPPETSGSAAGG
jgi:hypothetical protein